MAFALKDWVRDTSTTEGTDDFVLAGGVTPYRGFDDVLADGDTVHYVAYFDGDFESGLGTYDADTTTLARTTVFESSNGDAKVVWSAGTKIIECSPIASRLVTKDTPTERFIVTHSVSQNPNADVQVAFDTVIENEGGRFDAATDRVTLPAGKPWLMGISLGVTLADGYVSPNIRKNGSILYSFPGLANGGGSGYVASPGGSTLLIPDGGYFDITYSTNAGSYSIASGAARTRWWGVALR